MKILSVVRCIPDSPHSTHHEKNQVIEQRSKFLMCSCCTHWVGVELTTFERKTNPRKPGVELVRKAGRLENGCANGSKSGICARTVLELWKLPGPCGSTSTPKRRARRGKSIRTLALSSIMLEPGLLRPRLGPPAKKLGYRVL